MREALHHFHVRKRIHEKHESYPHPEKWKRRADKLIYVVGILGPIMTIPQVWKIWVEKTAAGVSLTSWASYAVLACVWFAYGYMHREKPIMFNYAIWIFLDILVVIGIVLYGMPIDF